MVIQFSSHHPTKSKPSFSDLGYNLLKVDPFSSVSDETSLPPDASKVTVTVFEQLDNKNVDKTMSKTVNFFIYFSNFNYSLSCNNNNSVYRSNVSRRSFLLI